MSCALIGTGGTTGAEITSLALILVLTYIQCVYVCVQVAEYLSVLL